MEFQILEDILQVEEEGLEAMRVAHLVNKVRGV